VDTGAKVVVVNGEALLETLHTFLEVLHFLVAHAHIVEGVRFGWFLVRVFSLDLDGFLQSVDSWLPLLKLVVDLALEKECL